MKGSKIIILAIAFKHKLNVTGLLTLTATIRCQAARATFIVVEVLGADVIIGCQYIDMAVEEINVKKRALGLKRKK